MAETRLAVLLLMLGGVAPRGAPRCLGVTECCELGEVEKAGAWLSEGHVISQPPSQGEEPQCQGRPHGPPNTRSITPWRYREDCDNARFPRVLLQAECLCPHCVSLAPPHRRDSRGNSVPVNASTLVYYRRPCPGRPGAYFLKPWRYPITVACVCVVPEF